MRVGPQCRTCTERLQSRSTQNRRNSWTILQVRLLVVFCLARVFCSDSKLASEFSGGRPLAGQPLAPNQTDPVWQASYYALHFGIVQVPAWLLAARTAGVNVHSYLSCALTVLTAFESPHRTEVCEAIDTPDGHLLYFTTRSRLSYGDPEAPWTADATHMAVITRIFNRDDCFAEFNAKYPWPLHLPSPPRQRFAFSPVDVIIHFVVRGRRRLF